MEWYRGPASRDDASPALGKTRRWLSARTVAGAERGRRGAREAEVRDRGRVRPRAWRWRVGPRAAWSHRIGPPHRGHVSSVGTKPHRAVGSLNRRHRARVGSGDALETEQAFSSLPQRAQKLLGESTDHLGAKTPIVPEQRSEAPGQRTDPVSDR